MGIWCCFGAYFIIGRPLTLDMLAITYVVDFYFDFSDTV